MDSENNIDLDLEELEKKQSEEDDSSEVPPSEIIAYNELRSCADIFRMYENEQLIIKPDFQRDVVWQNPAKTRFIDSLIKQLPIPSICISLDNQTQQRLVIDGLQRISTIINFLDLKKEFKLSVLDDIDGKISGKTNQQIKEKQNSLFERVENLTIPVTVLRCDYSKKSHMNYLFTIFHRLNTGGNKLNNQEIRNCIFHGSFNDLLKLLVKDSNFMKIYNINQYRTYRFLFEEKILRFLAFSKLFEEYKGKLANFLNDFMESYKEISVRDLDLIKDEFTKIHRLISEQISLPKNFNNFSKAIHEALYVGIQRNYESCASRSKSNLDSAFNNLIKDQFFQTDNLKEGLSQREKVIDRLTRSIEIFK
jgi:hypothetical protein